MFCKKGCDADGETWDECKFQFSIFSLISFLINRLQTLWYSCVVINLVGNSDAIDVNSGLGECDKVCYKDPVLKDKQWSAYIDRSPGSARSSEVRATSTS